MIGCEITNHDLTIPKLRTYYLPNSLIIQSIQIFYSYESKKVNSVKYLRLLIHNKLIWSANAHYLFLQLAKCGNILHQI